MIHETLIRVARFAGALFDAVLALVGAAACAVCLWNWFHGYPVEPSWLWGAIAYGTMSHIVAKQYLKNAIKAPAGPMHWTERHDAR